jgi:hypothetical protein
MKTTFKYILKVPGEEMYLYDIDYDTDGFTYIDNTTERKMAKYFDTKEEIIDFFNLVDDTPASRIRSH